MNALCYKIVFSKRLGTLVAVGEHTAGQGKAAGTGVRTVVFPSSSAASADNFVGLLKSVFASVALSFVTVGYATAAGPAVNTLPTGYSVNSGNVAISRTSSATNAAMTIKQTSDKASVNWNSFSIGSGAAVNVQQNNGNSVLLNRVVGNDPSQIFGKLTANGQVILINPNGVVFGKGGSVTASAFTASTFGMTDADFLAGKHKFSRNGSTAGVTVEEGARIDTTGYVALMGASVDNQGTITTQGGAVVLAAGDSVALPSALTDNISVPLSGKVRLEMLPSILNAMVANSGTITTEGGQVLMQAAALSDAVASITHTGTIDTTGVQGGAVTLQADHGIIKATGTIKANSTNDNTKGGDIVIGRDEETGVLAKSTDVSGSTIESKGGFVETSAHLLAVDGIKINAGTWLLDPDNIEITDAAAWTAGYSKISAAAISSALTSTSVVINTIGSEVNVASNSPSAGDGNILVNAAITKTGATATKLTLNADNGITVNQKISSTGGTLGVEMTALGNTSVTNNTANSKGITLNNVIDANGGVVTLTGTNKNAAGGNANSGVVFNGGSGITAGSFVVKGYQLGALSTSNIDKNGIYFNGASTLKSTGPSSLEGTSNSQGNLGAGIYAESGANLTLDSGATGTMRFAGGNSNPTYRGVRLGGTSNATINVKGNVSFEGTDANAVAKNGVFLRASVTQQSDSILTLKGSSVEIYQGTTVAKATNATNTTLNLGELPPDSSSTPAYANGFVNVGSAGLASLAADNINIVGSTSVDGKQGVLIQAASTLTANTIYVKGSALGAAGSSATAKGIHLSNGILNATNNITLDGTSTNVTGVALEAGSVTSSGGTVVIKATTTNGQFQGANIGVAVSGKSVEIKGNSTNHIGVNIGAAVTSTGGGVTIEGTSTNSTGVYVNNSVTSTAGDISITGISDKADGFYIGNILGTSKVTSNNGAVSITGTSNQQRGVWLDGNATVDSKVTGSTPIANAGVTIKGKSNGSVANNNVGAQIQGAVTAAGKLSITGDTLGVGLYQGVNISKAVSGDTVEITGTSVKHIGVSIQNTGSVTSIGATPTGSSSIVIDGTSYGSAVAVQGVSVAGTVKGASVFVKGMTDGNIGVDINAAVESTVGDIKLTGTGGSNYDYGQGVWTRSAGTLKSAKAITIDGTATNGASGAKTVIGAQIQGTVTAGTDISITGKNTSITDKAGLSIENTIKSTGGNITVTAENTSGTNTALSLSAAGKLLTDDNSKVININTNGMALNSSAVVQAGSSSTGTVNIKTIGNNHVSIGGVDVSSNSAASQELGITNTELGQIKAGNLVIGDTSKTGNITVSGAVSTLIPTGNLTLQTGGNIFLSQALTIASGKSLTLNGAGASSTISQANASAGITADQVEFLGSNATVSLQPTSSVNKIGVIAGNVKSFALTNQRDLTVSTVKSTEGLTAKDNIVLTTTTALGTALSIANKIESTTGNVEVNGTSSDATSSSYAAVKSWAAVKGKDVTMNAVALGTTGKTLGYYGAGINGKFIATHDLNLSASSANSGDGFYMIGGTLSAGNTATIKGVSATYQGVGLDKDPSNNIQITSFNGITINGTANTAGNDGIKFAGVDLANTAGALILTAIKGNINSNTANSLTQNGNGGVMLTTVGNGNITVPKIINNGTGNVVIAAGSDLLAGNGGGGQVKTVSGNTISQGYTTPGKTYIYSGKAADTGVLTQLDSTNFSTLKVTSNVDQNADTNVAYNAGAGITGSTAPAQVMFREKVSTGTAVLSGATVTNQTYGDAFTANTTLAAGELLKEAKTALKTANSGSYTIGIGTNNILIDKSAVIDSMYGSLSGPSYNSTSSYLKAATHSYGILSSTKYTTQDIAAGNVKVAVAQRALTGSIAQGNTTYGDALVAGAVNLTNKVGADVVDASGVTIATTGLTSTSGNLKAGSHADVQSVTGLTGADATNYSFANVKGDYKVDQKSLTALYAANNKVFDGNASALVTASLQDAVKGDVVSAPHTGANFDSADVGTGKTVTVAGISITGADAANYKISPTNNPGKTAKTTANITAVPATPPSPVVPSSTAARVKIPIGSSNPFALASAEDLTDDTCSANNIESCHCEESSVGQGIDICYEPRNQSR